jgi:orotate phosphoribosyltransferase
MTELALLPIVITLGRSAPEPVSDERTAFHRWLANRLRTGRWRVTGTQETLYLPLADLNSDDSTVNRLLTRRMKGETSDCVMIDLSANPYDLLRDPLLYDVLETTGDWVSAGPDRLAAILLPSLPPSSSLCWTAITRHRLRGRLALIDNAGQVKWSPESRNCQRETFKREYRQRHRRVTGSLDAQLNAKVFRRVGHFEVNGGRQCARLFFDAALAVDEITSMVVERLQPLMRDRSHRPTLLSHGERSPWLHEAAMSAAATLDISHQRLPATADGISAMGSVPRSGIAIFDVVSTGNTCTDVVNALKAKGVNLSPSVITVMLDSSLSSQLASGITVDCLTRVNCNKINRNDCPQCKIGLPYADPLVERHMEIRAYDWWDMLLSVGWPEETYGPQNARFFATAPDFAQVFATWGDWLAYKVEDLLKALDLHSDIVFVYPNESRINSLMGKLAPRLQDRLVGVWLPREILNTPVTSLPTGNGGSGTREGWRRQLEHLSTRPNARVVMLDEFNASYTTAQAMINVLRHYGVTPVAYIPIFNRCTDRADLHGVPIHSLYKIPSPRSR